MKIIFYIKQNGKCPVKEFIDQLQTKDRAKILACLKSVEDLGLESPRVQFRQIRGQLWEIKIRSISAGFRLFYVRIKSNTLILLHAYQKQSQKAPKNEIEVAEKRMFEVINDENDNS